MVTSLKLNICARKSRLTGVYSEENLPGRHQAKQARRQCNILIRGPVHGTLQCAGPADPISQRSYRAMEACFHPHSSLRTDSLGGGGGHAVYMFSVYYSMEITASHMSHIFLTFTWLNWKNVVVTCLLRVGWGILNTLVQFSCKKIVIRKQIMI
jgi:hypothetical protein